MDKAIELAGEFWVWFQQVVLSTETLIQLVVVLALVLIAWFAEKISAKYTEKFAARNKFFAKVDAFLRPLHLPFILLLLVLAAQLTAQAMSMPVDIYRIALSLLMAWVIIRLITSLIRNQTVARLAAIVIWLIAALDIVSLLEPLAETLKSATLRVGVSTISVYDVGWGIFIFFVFIWGALFLSHLVDTRLKSLRDVTPSARVLIGKVSKIVLVILAFLVALTTMGIDLTALAVFGGALGVGLGFGLQKVVSNFISGVILLMDRSIKPGDVIEIQDTYGTINKLAARYASVITRDGTEYLIPNENMITQPVINWSHTHRVVRRKVPLIVSYDTDLDLARTLMADAAKGLERVLQEPPPRALIKGFGDNGVNLELRFWINDPQNGVSNIGSNVMSAIWEKFRAAGIEFPFPQRVVHIREAGAKKTFRTPRKKPAPKAKK